MNRTFQDKAGSVRLGQGQGQVTKCRTKERNIKTLSCHGSPALNLAHQPPTTYPAGPKAASAIRSGPAGRWGQPPPPGQLASPTADRTVDVLSKGY